MRTKLTTLILLLTAICITGQPTQEKLDSFLSAFHDYKLFNGTVLVYYDGETILNKGYGYANLEFQVSNEPDVKFRIGSISKQFTAAVILKLVEEGKIKLDGYITDYLPEYRKDTGGKVTIHHLLTHTSGLPSYTNMPNVWSDSLRNHYEQDYFIEHFHSGDLISEPGEEWAYNNTGYYLLAVIAEKVSGKDFSDLLDEFILDPLEMNNSGSEEDGEVLNKRAYGYMGMTFKLLKEPYFYMPNALGAGQMYSTTGDLLKWHKALMSAEILSEGSTEKMMTPYMNNYGYGVIIDTAWVGPDSLQRTIITHSGGINGFNTNYLGLREDKTAVIIFNNMYRPRLREVTEGVLDILYGDEPEFPLRPIDIYIMERIADADLETALNEVRELHKQENPEYDFSERGINLLGYAFLNNEEPENAAKIFQLNIDLFPKSANVYDSMGEVYFVLGKNEKAIEYYKKSLELNPGNQNGIDYLKKLGVEYKREELNLPEELLLSYAGEYELFPDFLITIRTDGGKLFAQATGQAELEIFPKTESTFYYKEVEAQIEFVADENGEITNLILYQNGQELPAPKIKE